MKKEILNAERIKRQTVMVIVLGILAGITTLVIAANQSVIQRGLISDYKVCRVEANEDAADIDMATKTNSANAGALPTNIEIVSADGWFDMPGEQVGATEYWNMEFLFSAGSAADKTFTATLYTRASDTAPIRRVMSLACITGTAQVVAYPHNQSTATSKFWADTITVTSYHTTAIATSDAAGGNAIASIAIDALNQKHFKWVITSADGTTGTEAGDVQVYVRFFN